MLIMVLLWMILLVVLLCAEAKNLTEVNGQLGTDVTLTCSINKSSGTYWYMEIYSQLRGLIGQSLTPTEASYSLPEFQTEFSILGNKLMIKNVTAEDCRLYFCAEKRNGNIQFVDSFRLISDVTNNPQKNRMSQLIIIIISVSVTAAIVLIMSVGLTCLCLRRKNCRKNEENPSVHIYENAATLWAAQGKVHSQPAKHH